MPLFPPESPLDPYYWPFHMVLVAVLGACFGSFFNVCIYRIPLGVPLSMPPSHCYRCGSRVRWYDNVPLFSYWLLRGRCRSCGASFSMRYFLVELLTMLLMLTTVATIGYSWALAPAVIFTSLLIIATFTDIDHWIIPDRVNFGGLLAALVLAAIPAVGGAPRNPLAVALLPVPPAFGPLATALAGAAVGFIGLWLVGVLGSWIFRKEAMGFGDVKLFAMFGAFLGPEPLIYVLLIACLTGTLAGLLGIVLARLSSGLPVPAATAPLAMEGPAIEALLDAVPAEARLAPAERAQVGAMLAHPGGVGPIRHHLPFGPSLAVAAWIVYLFGDPLRTWLNALVWRLSAWIWGF